MTDPYVIPGTDVLANRLGCTTASELGALERTVTAIRIAELDQAPIPGGFDLDHLRGFHGWIFQDVYVWAGSLRSVEIEKGGITFCFAQHIGSAADEIFKRLAREDYLHGLSREGVVTPAAALFGDVNQLHPFREGNGRATRAFLRQLLREAGWDIDWSAVLASSGSDGWIEASRAAAVGDPTLISKVLDAHLEQL